MDYLEFRKYLKANFKTTSSFLSGLTLFFVDFLTLLLCFGLGFFIVNLFAIHNINFKSFINYAVFFPFIFILFLCFNLYPGIMTSPAEELKKFSGSTFISFLFIIVLIIYTEQAGYQFINKIVKNTEILQLIFAFLITFVFSAVLLTANRALAKIFFSKFRYWGVPAVIYCNGDSANKVIEKLVQNKRLGYHPAVIIDSSITDSSSSKFLDIPRFSISDKEIIKIIHEYNIKTAILCDFNADTTHIMSTYRYTIAVSNKQNSFTTTQSLKDIAGIIGFASTHNLTFLSNRIIKRLFDLLIIVVLLPILLPVFLTLIILTKVTSKGPVFYGHKRIGKNGKEFSCWKFRSMNINSAQMLEEILKNDPERRIEWERERKFKDDPRVTKFGKFLRKTSLDELPQLINIITGQMSFIGPRPVTYDETLRYGEYRDLVLSVTPGLSGMWQISGRSETTYEERIFLDTFYIQNWSIWLDFWIIIKTVWVVISGKGAF